jgi:anion-transporting  ArsA/GET3 family ATPase
LLRQDWREKKIIFVSGKGGVGKSLVAAAAAQEAARDGRRALLVELGETSYYKDFWGLAEVGHHPRPTEGGFDLALWSGETCLREYVLHYLRLERLYSVFFENKVMRSLINVAPGLSEIAIAGKITSGIRRVGPALDYDLIVVDGYATGHALALLRAPAGIAEAIRFGPMGAHSREIGAILKDRSACAYWTVALLEELPVAETIEFASALRAEMGVATSVVANKAVSRPVAEPELERLGAGPAGGVAEFARYLLAVSRRQAGFVEALAASGLRPALAPMVYSDAPNALVARVGEALRTA